MGLLVLLLFSLFISGCSAFDEIQAVCRVGETPANRFCEIKGTKTMGSLDPGMSVGLLSVDVSKSTAIIRSSQVYVTISAYSNGVALESRTFEFEKTGDHYVPIDPFAIDLFILGYEDTADKFAYTTSELNVSATNPGVNSLIAEVIYDDTVIDGAVYSWYAAGGSDSPQDPF